MFSGGLSRCAKEGGGRANLRSTEIRRRVRGISRKFQYRDGVFGMSSKIYRTAVSVCALLHRAYLPIYLSTYQAAYIARQITVDPNLKICQTAERVNEVVRFDEDSN